MLLLLSFRLRVAFDVPSNMCLFCLRFAFPIRRKTVTLFIASANIIVYAHTTAHLDSLGSHQPCYSQKSRGNLYTILKLIFVVEVPLGFGNIFTLPK